MKLLRTIMAISALSLFAGCVGVPAYPEYAVAPAPYYAAPAYYPPPGYYGPAYYGPAYYGPAYYPPRAYYYGPSLGIGIYGGWRGGHRHGGRGRRG